VEGIPVWQAAQEIGALLEKGRQKNSSPD